MTEGLSEDLVGGGGGESVLDSDMLNGNEEKLAADASERIQMRLSLFGQQIFENEAIVVTQKRPKKLIIVTCFGARLCPLATCSYMA